MQKWLLTEKDLTFKGANGINHGMESAVRHAKSLQGGASPTESEWYSKQAGAGIHKGMLQVWSAISQASTMPLQKYQMPQLW